MGKRGIQEEDMVRGEMVQGGDMPEEGGIPSSRPIEPERRPFTRNTYFRWGLFFALGIWVALTVYHEPLLSRIGGFLVVSHELQESDLIVCLSGRAVERSLAAADIYREGLAPRVFVAREVPPDGHDVLEREGIRIPETVDVATRILAGRGVPTEAVIVSKDPAVSTESEAAMVRALVQEKGWDSVIVITSPTHARRAWWMFRHAMEKEGVRIQVAPSTYSGFRAEDWWKTRRYVREVIVEYQKLLFYALAYFLA